jgi:hypothetical protein
MHKNQYMDATCECLSDHGIAPDDVIEILVSYRQGTDVNSGPRAPVSPMRRRPQTTTPPRTRYSNRNGERGDQNSELAQEKGITKSQRQSKTDLQMPALFWEREGLEIMEQRVSEILVDLGVRVCFAT